jgi:hypothetical protein
LFGNSSGSSSQTKNRGPDGSSENDTSSTGSATVKILRPPSEEGDSPKLQKTPALNNDSIVDLVEAGFSDGTIIRRIEQSPANFNLSPASIENLHKRHVTDKVIAAMTSAMGDDPSGGKQTRN